MEEIVSKHRVRSQIISAGRMMREAEAGIWGAVIYLDLPRHSISGCLVLGGVRWAPDLGGNLLTLSNCIEDFQ